MAFDLQAIAGKNTLEHFVDNPCRGIVLGVSKNNIGMQIAWIMGRSSNSRNRVYVVDKEKKLMRTEAADPSKVEDPSLIIYNVMRSRENMHVVSNGDQTDTIIDNEEFPDIHAPTAEIFRGTNMFYTQFFYEALDGRYCEPDPPIFTPRISGFQNVKDPCDICISVLKADPFKRQQWIDAQKAMNDAGYTLDHFKRCAKSDKEAMKMYLDAIDRKAKVDRFKFPTLYREYKQRVEPGYGYCVTTYMPGSKDLPSFEREPVLVPMLSELEGTMQNFWNVLETEHRVSLGGKEFTPHTTRFAEPMNNYSRISIPG